MIVTEHNKDTNLLLKVAGKLITNDKGNVELLSLLQSPWMNLDPKSLCHQVVEQMVNPQEIESRDHLYQKDMYKSMRPAR